MAVESKRSDRRSRAGAILMWSTFIIGIASVLLISPANGEVRALLQSLGPVAPLAVLLGEVIQVVVIPIPGQPLEVASGWMLGMFGGSVVATVGAVGGSLAAFHLARRFGRDWVADRVPGGIQDRVASGLADGKRTEWIVFILMMIPNFPRDPLCYVAGVSGMSARSFFLIALLGRPVGLVPWVALGANGAAAALWWQLGCIVVAGALWGLPRLVARATEPAFVPVEPAPEAE